jgi:hypothetical protein
MVASDEETPEQLAKLVLEKIHLGSKITCCRA